MFDTRHPSNDFVEKSFPCLSPDSSQFFRARDSQWEFTAVRMVGNARELSQGLMQVLRTDANPSFFVVAQ